MNGGPEILDLSDQEVYHIPNEPKMTQEVRLFMKDKLLLALGVFCGVLLVVTIGFFVGRNTGSAEIITNRIPPATEAVDILAAMETQPSETTEPPATEPRYPININTADAETLTYLPGIGPELAARIVDYREANGVYLELTELLNVSGIGPGRLEKILPYITVGSPKPYSGGEVIMDGP